MKVISYEKHREPIKIGCLFYVQDQQEMTDRKQVNREASAHNGGGNPVGSVLLI